MYRKVELTIAEALSRGAIWQQPDFESTELLIGRKNKCY